MLLVKGSHCGTAGWYYTVDKEEKGILWSQVDTFADQEVELTNSQVRWYKVLLFVEVTNSSLGSLLHYDLEQETQNVYICPENFLYIMTGMNFLDRYLENNNVFALCGNCN